MATLDLIPDGTTKNLGLKWSLYGSGVTKFHMALDEDPPDDATTYGFLAPAGLPVSAVDEVSLSDPGISAGEITNVDLLHRHYGGTLLTTRWIRTGLVIGGVTYWNSWVVARRVWRTDTISYPTSPATGLAWTWAELVALKAKIEGDADGPADEMRTTYLRARVTYIPAPDPLEEDLLTADVAVAAGDLSADYLRRENPSINLALNRAPEISLELDLSPSLEATLNRSPSLDLDLDPTPEVEVKLDRAPEMDLEMDP